MNPKSEQPFEPEVMETEIRGESLVDVLRGGAAITKAENDTLAQIAITRPRDPQKSLARALAELEIDPEFAEKQYYVIPFRNADGTKSDVEGLSIKAAMALARCWGNCTNSARLVEETEDAFIVEGVAIDFETMFRVSKVGSISKWLRDRKSKKMVKVREDRFPQLLGAGASKQVRNAILNMIPEPIQRRYWARAKEIAAGRLTGQAKPKPGTKGRSKGGFEDIAKVIDKVLAAFAPLGVQREHIEAKLGHPMDDLTMDDIGKLKGLENAIRDGSTDIYQAFSIEMPMDNGNGEGASPDVQVADLFGGRAK